MKTFLTCVAVITLPIWIVPFTVVMIYIIVSDLYDDHTKPHIPYH